MEFPRFDIHHPKGVHPKAPTGKLPAAPAPAPPAAPAQPPAGVDTRGTPDAHDLFADFMPWGEHHVQKLDERTQQVVGKLKQTGDWEHGDPPLGEQVESFLAGGGNPKLASAILEQIRHPRHIHQVGGKNTCAAAAAQELLATRDPAKYFQLASELMSTGHSRVNPGNHGFVVTDENRAFIAEQRFEPGSKINATVQAALLEYANGFVKYGGDLYHMKQDSSDHDGDDAHKGVSYKQFNSLTKALVGSTVFADQFEPMSFHWGSFRWGMGGQVEASQRAEFVQKLGEGVQGMMERNPDGFLMTIHGEHRPHAVMVTAFDPATGQVSYHDPRNTTDQDVHCSLDQLADRITKPERNVGDGGGSSGTMSGVRVGRTPVSPPPPPPAPTTT